MSLFILSILSSLLSFFIAYIYSKRKVIKKAFKRDIF